MMLSSHIDVDEMERVELKYMGEEYDTEGNASRRRWILGQHQQRNVIMERKTSEIRDRLDES